MKLIIPKEVEEKIHAYTMSVDSEIAGMGKVRLEGTDTIVVEDVMIYEQDVSGATADLSPKAMAKWMSDLVRAGGSPKHWKLWFHSHDTMSAFFSKRDTDTMDLQTESDWMCSLVVNKKRERQARLDMYRPFRMYMEDLEIEVEGAEKYSVPADIAKEVAEKVKTRVEVGYGAGYSAKDTDDEWDAGGYAKPRSIKGVVGLHEYCPTQWNGGNECYAPYGKDAEGVYANCTTKEFKKMYGARMKKKKRSAPNIEEYDKVEMSAIIVDLEKEIDDMENRGAGDKDECTALRSELVDWYYALAELEADENIAESIRGEARLIEEQITQIEERPYAGIGV